VYYAPINMNIHKLTAGKASLLALATATLVFGILFFRTTGLVSADHSDQNDGHYDHATATPTPTPTPTSNDHDSHDGSGDCHKPTSTPTPTPTKNPCDNFNRDHKDDHDKNCQTPTPTPTTSPTVSPPATPNPDVCANIDGIQTSVPDGMHLDASGQNCVNWSQGGGDGQGCATQDCSGNYVAPPQGQVLGASTMATTGSFEEVFYQAIMGIGATISAFGLKGLKKVRKVIKK